VGWGAVEEEWAGVAETDLDWAVVLGSDWAAVAAGWGLAETEGLVLAAAVAGSGLETVEEWD